jgi:hypothetical protein
MPSPWEKTVNVYLDSIDPVTGKPHFRIEPAPPNPLPTSNGILVFNNNHRPGFHIHFIFTDNTGQNYTFPPNNQKDQAVSSQLGATNLCPPQGTSQVFSALRVDGPSNNTLTVRNPNINPALGLFSYVLWVTNNGGANYLPLDPGGTNDNGPVAAPFLPWAMLAVAVAVVAIAAFAAYEFGLFAH